MKTPEELGQYLQTLIERHRKDLSILLEEIGIIDEELTPKLLILLYERFGDDFLHELASLGEDTFESLPLEHLEGSTLVDKLVSFFQKGKALVTGITQSTPTTTAADTATVEAPKISTQKLLIIGASIIVVLVVIFLIVKRKN